MLRSELFNTHIHGEKVPLLYIHLLGGTGEMLGLGFCVKTGLFQACA